MLRRRTGLLVMILGVVNGLWAQGVVLEWDANTESDLAGYKVYWGRTSRFYSAMVDVGLNTQFTLTEFPEEGQTYVAVTAYDQTFNESGFSAELVLENAQARMQFELNPSYPNPSNPSAKFPYTLTTRLEVHLAIYDVLGRLVAILHEGPVDPGNHEAEWDGRDRYGQSVAGGVYFCRLRVGDFCMTRKFIVLH